MLEIYYQYPRVLKRLRGGALGDEMDHIAEYLSKKGYKAASVKIYLERIARFSRFAEQTPATTIGRDVIDRFLLSRESASARIGSQTAIAHVLKMLPERFESERHRDSFSNDPLLIAYAEHLRQVRGLQPKTCEGLMLTGRRILEWQQEHRPNEPLSTITGEHVLTLVQNFLALHANDYTRSSTTSYIRSFLRFLQWTGVIEQDLARFVPRTPCRRMAHLPARVAWDDVKRTIQTIEITSPIGVRDRAMLLLLATTGLRNKELRSLELRDIHWRSGEVLVRRTKGRRDRLVPLLPEAGAALADYVLHARPKVANARLFLSHTPPVRPIDCSSTVSRIVRCRLEQCGLKLPRAGAHLLRHSLATRLVGQQRPIKEVADLMGHQNIDTTAIYVKVALPQLAIVALPFPEVSHE
jgi:site-specific recombinase XerD